MEIGTKGWEEKFRKLFREICTVKIDAIEYTETGTIPPDQKIILDSSQW